MDIKHYKCCLIMALIHHRQHQNETSSVAADNRIRIRYSPPGCKPRYSDRCPSCLNYLDMGHKEDCSCKPATYEAVYKTRPICTQIRSTTGVAYLKASRLD
eukprot:g44048.t1